MSAGQPVIGTDRWKQAEEQMRKQEMRMFAAVSNCQSLMVISVTLGVRQQLPCLIACQDLCCCESLPFAGATTTSCSVIGSRADLFCASVDTAAICACGNGGL